MKEFLETELENLQDQQASQNVEALNAVAVGFTQQAEMMNNLAEQTVNNIEQVVTEMEKGDE